MGTDNPKQLLQTVFFYVGKVYCLRGGVGQRGLKVSSFSEETVQIIMCMLRMVKKITLELGLRVEN